MRCGLSTEGPWIAAAAIDKPPLGGAGAAFTRRGHALAVPPA